MRRRACETSGGKRVRAQNTSSSVKTILVFFGLRCIIEVITLITEEFIGLENNPNNAF